MLSVLSNVNTDYITKILSQNMDIVPPSGYGDIWGQILNNNSVFNEYNPDKVVFIVDIEELTRGFITIKEAEIIIDNWFDQFLMVASPEKDYFVSDVSFRSSEISDNDSFLHSLVESYWQSKLSSCVDCLVNIHVLKLRNILEEIGKRKFFSEKLWYLGKIPFTNEASTLIACKIKHTVELVERVSKKVLVLDLDNTLWGGILGEKGPDGIELSDDHLGAIYKSVQYKIKEMQRLGIMLAICSKNNESDVDEVWNKNSHMVLKKDDFVSRMINWDDKTANILKIAEDLNVGIDSFVFIDDMQSERENIKLRLKDVEVPEFPSKIDDYPGFIDDIYIHYFQRIRSTNEDRTKTRQYIENSKRTEAAKGLSYDDFLKSLSLKVNRVELDEKRIERVVQLLGKTNQFNLTTKRYDRNEINRIIKSGNKVYAYNVSDKFGDYGLVAVVIVNTNEAIIDTFAMSCRVMGKLVENYILDTVESDLIDEGFTSLKAEYIRTQKNVPVELLYDKLGYSVIEKEENRVLYEIKLLDRPKRQYYVEE